METRITSYNVCYTKLLRATAIAKADLIVTELAVFSIGENGLILEEIDSVITSYSIHYTKLYDGRHIIRSGFTFGDWLAADGICDQSMIGGTEGQI